MAKLKKPEMPSRETVKEFLKNNIIWLVGCSLYAIAVNSFSAPNEIAQSGATGLAVVANYLFDVPIGVANFVINVPLFILAGIFIGRKFVLSTLWVTTMLSIALDVWGFIIPPYQGDKLLAAIFAGVLSGAGLGIVLITGATSGGTDIVSRLVHQKWPHISIGKVLLVADAAVVLLAAVVFGSIESALYAAILIFASTKVIDSVIYGTANGKMLMIVTEKADEVASAITSQTPRGVSIVPVEGAYTGEKKHMLVCVVRSSEVSGVMRIVRQTDDKTFTIVSEASEILGKGFKKKL